MDNLSPEQLAALRADDRGPLCERIVIAFTVMSFVSVCSRLFARIRYHKTGWEDWTIVVAMMASIGTCTFQVLQVRAGNGKHAVLVRYPEGVEEILKTLYFSIITYNISLTITKISILLQYHRIFTLREMRIPVYVALVVVIAWGITTLFTSIFSCVPVHSYWKVTEQIGAVCLNRMALWYTNASVNIFTDLMVAVIPVRGIWNLQIPNRQKIAVLGILTIGWFVCIVSVLRVFALNEFQKHQDDATYYSAPTAYWSCIEANLAIVCASLPALKPLIVRIVPVFGSRNSRATAPTMGNSYILHKLSSKSWWKTGDDKERLTSETNTSRAQTLASRRSEIERQGKSIYVTKHFEQHIESRRDRNDSDEELTAAEVSACNDGPEHGNVRRDR